MNNKSVLIKNSSSGIFQSIISALLVFITIPIFRRLLGSEGYGLFALVMIVGNLNSFVNFGLNGALTKFIAEQGKTHESFIDLITNILFFIIIFVPTTFLIIYFYKFCLLYILKIPIHQIANVKSFFILTVISNSLIFFGQIFKSVLDGLQKIYVANIFQLVYNFLYWILILVFLSYGWGFFGIGLSLLISSLIWFLLILFMFFFEWGLSFHRISLNSIVSSSKKQLKFSFQLYTSGLIGFFYEPFSKILISTFFSVDIVGYYDIALRIKNTLFGLISKALYPLYPFIAQLSDFNEIRKYIHDIEQKLAFLFLPVIILLKFITYPIIALWLGNDVDIISNFVFFIVGSHIFFSSIVIPIYHYLTAKDLAGKTIIIQFANVLVNTVVFFLTYKYIGFYGILCSNVIAIISSFAISLYFQKRFLDSMIFNSMVQFRKFLICGFVIFVLAEIVNYFIIEHMSKIAIMTIIILIITIVFYRYFKILNLNDINRYFGEQLKFNKIISFLFIKM